MLRVKMEAKVEADFECPVPDAKEYGDYSRYLEKVLELAKDKIYRDAKQMGYQTWDVDVHIYDDKNKYADVVTCVDGVSKIDEKRGPRVFKKAKEQTESSTEPVPMYATVLMETLEHFTPPAEGVVSGKDYLYKAAHYALAEAEEKYRLVLPGVTYKRVRLFRTNDTWSMDTLCELVPKQSFNVHSKGDTWVGKYEERNATIVFEDKVWFRFKNMEIQFKPKGGVEKYRKIHPNLIVDFYYSADVKVLVWNDRNGGRHEYKCNGTDWIIKSI